MSDFSPECAPKRTSTDQSELGSRDLTDPYSANSVQMIHDFLSLTKAIYHYVLRTLPCHCASRLPR